MNANADTADASPAQPFCLECTHPAPSELFGERINFMMGSNVLHNSTLVLQEPAAQGDMT